MIVKSYRDIMHDWTLECGCNTTIFPCKMGLVEVFKVKVKPKTKFTVKPRYHSL
jgi:hypothetical protein